MRQITIHITFPEGELDPIAFDEVKDMLRAGIEKTMRTAIGVYEFQGEVIRFEGDPAPQDAMMRAFGVDIRKIGEA